MAPWIAGFLLFEAGPTITAGVLAFAAWQPPLPLQWTGLANLRTMLGDPLFWQTLGNTVVYAVGTVVPGLAIGLGLALLLRPVRRGGTFLRSAVFLPAIVSGVATALVWGWILNPRFGLVNAILGLVGIRGPAWLQDPGWAMPALIVIGLWNVGVNVVVYLAALGTVPADLHEAAALDGAGALARFRAVTWPALTPITFYLAIVNVIGAFQVFTPTYLLTGGGPDHATLTLALYTYQNAFSFGQLGYASALALAMVVIIVGLTAIQFRVLGRRVAYLGADG
ncbi:MAG TPA: sugar ABC transporter permease [Candidatus Limnocylindrales bacterium]|nr:sugar ABC transporter permease [Candidatus Limnocylindrales bacterium]